MIYVMSDIHGNKAAFDSILNQINLKDDDQLYILGDVIDRQKYGIDILRQIMNMSNVHMLLGNHEYMMMDALGFPYEPNGCTQDITMNEKRDQWFSNGGNITNRTWIKLTTEQKYAIKSYLKNLPLEYNVEVNGKLFKLVHAVPCGLYDILIKEYSDQFPESRAYFSVWERDLIHVLEENENFTTIFGHTPTCNLTKEMPMKIYHKGNIIGIDCGSAYRKSEKDYGCRLACLRLDDMKEFYSN